MDVLLTHAPCDECAGRSEAGLTGYDAMCRRCLIANNAELAQIAAEARRIAEELRDIVESDSGEKWPLPWALTAPEAVIARGIKDGHIDEDALEEYTATTSVEVTF